MAVDDEKEEEERLRAEQTQLDDCAEGFQVGRLSKLMGNEAANYSAGLEDLYGKMLVKIETLARQVEQSSALVFEQVIVRFSLICSRKSLNFDLNYAL